MTSIKKGNLCGIGALLMWCMFNGLIKSITDSFGPILGVALIYTVGSLAKPLATGMPNLRAIPKIYLFGVGAIFILFEVAFSQAIGLSASPKQTLEVGMVNYLWPSLTILFSIWINHTRLYWWVWPGALLSICGLYVCLTANSGLDAFAFFHNLVRTPIPYMLAFISGISWALYSNFSLKYSQGHNGTPIFFAVIACILWIEFMLSNETLHFPGIIPCVQLVAVGAMMGLSYSMWEVGIHQGNFLLIAVCSYFSPAGSMLFASLILSVIPPPMFWLGVSLVICGSIICWLATAKK